MVCPGEARLEELAAGNLPADDTESVTAHIRGCSRCAQFMEEYGANHELARELQDAFSGPELSLGNVTLSRLLSETREPIEQSPEGPPAPGELPPDGSIPGYQIIREIHRGGQGVVYEAGQLSTKRTVAVKVLLEGPFAGERSRQRFEREVDLVAHMKHPHIVAIHDSGIALGRYFFAMDYVCGRPLDTHVRVKAPTVWEIIRLFTQVCDAVGYAHRRGVIHRDLKPSNILVDEAGEPQVLDFGLAKVLAYGHEEARDSLVTMPGQLIGTLRYMSPEQTRGDPEAIDTRTDIYSLGVILYELLAGRPPYPTNADITETFRHIRETDPPSLARRRRAVPADLEAIIRKAMHKDPERRYLSAGELAEDLRAWLDGRPVTARSDSAFYVLRKLAVRHYFHTSVIAALLASMVGFGAITYQALQHQRQSAAELIKLNDQYARDNANLQAAFARARDKQDEQVFGWFLEEWYAGRLRAAREIRNWMESGSPEHAAAGFLLDDRHTVEQLRAEVPPGAIALVHFAAGERHRKAGRLAEAVQAFQEALRTDHGIWAMLIRARLEQLGVAPSESRIRPSEAGSPHGAES